MSILRKAYKRKWMWVLTGVVVGAGLSGGMLPQLDLFFQ
jgi:hypothetical protein